jgi:hypothetical protein
MNEYGFEKLLHNFKLERFNHDIIKQLRIREGEYIKFMTPNLELNIKGDSQGIPAA